MKTEQTEREHDAPGSGGQGEADASGPRLHADFSLVAGGPSYQLWRKAGLTGDAMQLLRRRVVVLALLAWAPLLALSIAEGSAWGEGVELPFLYDFEVHVRFLLALPLLLATELVVHRRLPSLVRPFVDRGLIPDAARPKFDAALASTLRLRNSTAAEALLIAFVYVFGVGYIWRTQMPLQVASWRGEAGGGMDPSAAGWWLGLVSLPLFQFLLLRWYFRLVIWARFLWRVSRIDLKLMPAHPDRSGGLGFLTLVGHSFSPFLLAQGAILAGMIANRIFYSGATLPEFKLELAAVVAAMVLAIFAPLLVFTPQLEAARRAGMGEYGGLAHRYVREFDRKWLRGGAPAGEPLVGSQDVQALADVGHSFELVKRMRWTPFALQSVMHLALVTLAPVAPLTLTMIPVEEVLDRLLELVL